VTQYGPIEPLGSDHDLEQFDCGSEEQTTWLRRHARQSHASDTSKVYVACPAGTPNVVGYYALSAGSVGHEAVPPRVARGIGRYPVPILVLTRLGVDVNHQKRGLGRALVKDALLQTASIADRVGVRALVIHAESDNAAAFYLDLAIGFERSPTDPLHLILLMKDLRRAIDDASGS
jgi:ribosomal protein S18 acetylase RimI-like enzyme